jgi:hypothetical protein
MNSKRGAPPSWPAIARTERRFSENAVFRASAALTCGASIMSIATIIAVAAIMVAFGLVGAIVAWTFARMPIDIR